MRDVRRSRAAALATRGAAVALAGAALAPAVANAQERARFDTRVFALIPRPGFPANAYAAPNGHVYEGTYEDPNGSALPSRVLEYSPGGTLLRSVTIRGQDLGAAHGVQATTSDGAGRVVVLDTAPPRAIKVDMATDEQTGYADFPAGSVPNHSVWGPDGSLYVTDYAKPILWRIPPGGGTPEKWLEDPRFDGGPFGMTGIGLTPDHKTLLVGMQSELGGADGDPATGRIYKVAIGEDGKAGPPRAFWESSIADGPDAFGVAQSGKVYVALLLANAIAVVGTDGKEIERFGPDNGSPVPFDNPSNVRFSGSRLLVANQSFIMGDATHQAILDVWAGEPGLPELIPPDPQVEARKAAEAAAAKRATRDRKLARDARARALRASARALSRARR